ncbi:MAG: PP0621 family protein [Campylobacterota bacterium]|nr:PP0621 family protein [Campylobacterota bacterium]
MLKYLLVIGVIAFIYYFFIKKKPLKKPTDKEQKDTKTNDMTQCERCGVYCEIEDAILSNGKYYCSSECLRGIK